MLLPHSSWGTEGTWGWLQPPAQLSLSCPALLFQRGVTCSLFKLETPAFAWSCNGRLSQTDTSSKWSEHVLTAPDLGWVLLVSAGTGPSLWVL